MGYERAGKKARGPAGLLLLVILAACLGLMTACTGSGGYQGYGSLEGTVIGPPHSGNGLPTEKLAGVEVAYGEGLFRTTVTTDGAGHFLFPRIPPGRWTITLSAAGYETATLTAEIAAGKTATLKNFNFDGVCLLSSSTQKAKWTILLYMSGVDMESVLPVDMKKLQDAGSREGINIVAYVYNPQDESGASTKLYYMRKSGGTFDSPCYDYNREIEMADARNLQEFLETGVHLYPADRYMVVLWDHGSGIDITYSASGASSAGRTPQSVIATRGREITVPEVGRVMTAFTQDHPIDILAADACLMGMFEFAYEMKNARIDYMVFSEAVEGGGYSYDRTLAGPRFTKDTSALTLGKNLVQDYIAVMKETGSGNGTLSAVNMNKLFAAGGVVEQYNALAARLSKLSAAELAGIQNNVIQKTQSFGRTEGNMEYHFLDLRDFCKRLSLAGYANPEADALYAGLAQGDDQAIVASDHHNQPGDQASYADANGLSTFILRVNGTDNAYLGSRYPKIYRTVKYYLDGNTDWDAFLAGAAP